MDCGNTNLCELVFLKDAEAFTDVNPTTFTFPLFLGLGFYYVCATPSGSLLFSPMNVLIKGMKQIDCSSFPPKEVTVAHRNKLDYSWSSICSIQKEGREFIVKGDITSRELEWTLSDYPESSETFIRFGNLTPDENGHLFVFDNTSRHIYATFEEGKYLYCLLKEGEEGIGEIKKIKWNKVESCLMVAHCKNMRTHISLARYNF